MGRYSPTVAPYAGPDFETTLSRAIGFLRQEELDREAEQDRARRRELEDVALYERGYRRFDEAPTVEQTVERPDVTRGAPIGRQATDQRPPLFDDARMGLQGRSSPSALARALGAPAPRGPAPGALNPATLTFATPGETETVGHIGMARPTTTEAPDPRYTRVAGSIYRDERDNPDARAAAAHERQQSELAGALAQLRDMDPAEAAALAEALGQGVPASFLERPEPEPEGFTRAELLSAGVEEEDVDAALKDNVLARELIRAANRPPPRGADPYGGLGRDQYFQDFEEREKIRSRYGGRSRSETGDPRLEERRKAIIAQIGEPTTVARQAALDALAAGSDPESVLDRMWELGYPDEEIQDVEDYLSMFGLGG